MTRIGHAAPPARPRGAAAGWVVLLALGASAIGLGVAWVMSPFLTTYTVLPSIGAIVVSAWLGGVSAGVATAVISVIGIDLLFIGAPGTVGTTTPSGDALRLVLFAIAAALVLGAVHRLRATADQAAREATEARALARRVEEQEDRFDLLVSAVVDYAIFALDPEGRITTWNAGAHRIKGWTAEEIMGQHFSIFYPEELRGTGEIEGELASALANGRFEEEGWRVRKDGSRFWANVVITALRDQHGAHIGFTKITRDLTQRREAELALRASEQRLRATFEQAAVGIALVGLDGRWLLVNDRLLEISGYGRDELLALTFQDITHPDDLAEDLELARQTIAGEIETYSLEKRYIRPDQSLVWVNLTVSLVRHDDGRPAYFISVAEDVTRRRSAEAKVRQANEALLRANAELAATTYAMAHDLRSPLRAIDAYSLIIADEYADQLDDRARQQFERIRTNAQRMGHLIDGLLALAKLGRGDLSRERVDLSDMARRILTDLTAIERDRRFTLRVTGGMKTVADARLTRVVLENLLGNAVKFTRGRDPAVIEFGAMRGEPPDSEPTYFVRDNGVGFAPEHAGQLFRPFHRLHNDREFEGTGIGLATVWRVVERHGGRVWAEGAPGVGATVFFTLAPDRSRDGATAGEPSGSQVKGMKQQTTA